MSISALEAELRHNKNTKRCAKNEQFLVNQKKVGLVKALNIFFLSKSLKYCYKSFSTFFQLSSGAKIM